MSASTASPALVLRRYFLSQMSAEAGCIGMSLVVVFFTASRRTLLMLVGSPCCSLARVVPVPVVLVGCSVALEPCVDRCCCCRACRGTRCSDGEAAPPARVAPEFRGFCRWHLPP